MTNDSFSYKDLFAFDDNGVPPVIRDCFIGLIAPFEELFDGGRVPARSSSAFASNRDFTREPTYPSLHDFKKDWLEWIYLELKVRLNCGVRYYNFRGEVLSPENANRTPIILFLRKFRRVDTGLSAFMGEDPGVVIRQMGALQSAVSFDVDTTLRGEIERKFPSYPVMWIANPTDALSFSGYLTHDASAGGYELNENSYPYLLTPMWNQIQRWQESAEHLIRASDAIVFANTSTEGGLREEQDLLYAANAIERTFVTNPENLESAAGGFRRVDELTEEVLGTLTGADGSNIEQLGGWGHWAGFKSLEYAHQYFAAIDDQWGRALDSGQDVSPGYFAALFTALIALLLFRGDLKAAGDLTMSLAAMIDARMKGEEVPYLKGAGAFHPQDMKALPVLVGTARWYRERSDVYRTVVGFAALDAKKK